MRQSIAAAALIVCWSVPWLEAADDKPLVLDLWPGKVAPGDNASAIGAEKFFEAPPLKSKPDTPYRVAGKPCLLVTNVTRPTLTIYRPVKEKDTGVAMVICPGGGYHALYWDIHGTEVAEWLRSIGLTGILLKYRCPCRPGEEKTEPASGPIQDAQRALSLVRGKASEWGIDPRKIGVVGFSAGGHLAGAAATHFDRRSYEPLDDIDKISCRPDFAVMVYPGYLKLRDQEQLAPRVRVPTQTPPILLVVAGDDQNVGAPEGCALFYLSLRRAGIPAELHAFVAGGHPFGVRKQGLPSDAWPRLCEGWLRQQGVFGKP